MQALEALEPPTQLAATDESVPATPRRGLRVTLACGARFLFTSKGWPRPTFYCPKCGKTCRTKDVQAADGPGDAHAMARVMAANKAPRR